MILRRLDDELDLTIWVRCRKCEHEAGLHSSQLIERYGGRTLIADALARLRQHLWFERIVTSTRGSDMTEPLPPAVQGILETACYAP